MKKTSPRVVVYSLTAVAIVGVWYAGSRREVRMSAEVDTADAHSPKISATVQPRGADDAMITTSRLRAADQARNKEQKPSIDIVAWEQKNGYTLVAGKGYTEGGSDFRWYVNRSGRPVVFQRQTDAPNETSGIEWFADSLVVVTHQPQAESGLLSQLKAAGVTAVSSLGTPVMWRVTIAPADAREFEQTMEKIKDSPAVSLVEHNTVVRRGKFSNDPLLPTLYAAGDPDSSAIFGRNTVLPRVNVAASMKAALAWDTKRDCSAIRVAVIDSGIDAEHPDLSANVNKQLSRNFVSGIDLAKNCDTGQLPAGSNATATPPPNQFEDADGHGTHVSGTIGAVGNNGVGIAGVCWKAEIVALRVFGKCGEGAENAVTLAAMNYAADIKAKVVNMSLGGNTSANAIGPNSPGYAAVSRIANAGGLVVVAAGNDTEDIVAVTKFPASLRHPALVTIASHNANNEISEFSNFSSQYVHLSAPGERIMSTWPRQLVPRSLGLRQVPPNLNVTEKFRAAITAMPDRGYEYLDGTSMASPNAAGVFALVWSLAPNRSATEIRDIVFGSADQEPTFQNKIISGRRINLERAVASLGGLSVKVSNAPAQSKVNEASAGVGAPLLVSLEGVPEDSLKNAKLLLGTTEVGTCSAGDGTCVGEIPSTMQAPADGAALPLSVSSSAGGSAIPVAGVRVMNLSTANGLFLAGQSKSFCRVLADNKTLAVFPTANKNICNNVCRKLLAGANRNAGRCDFADQSTSVQTEACNVGARQ
ncbi:MAG: hypothetical protein RLZZ488_2742 [Pseudomonadota bacterium]|jgi:subtilisin family serine protease